MLVEVEIKFEICPNEGNGQRVKGEGRGSQQIERSALCHLTSVNLGVCASNERQPDLGAPYPGASILHSAVRGHWTALPDALHQVHVPSQCVRGLLRYCPRTAKSPSNSAHDKEANPYHGTSGLMVRMMTCPWNRTGTSCQHDATFRATRTPFGPHACHNKPACGSVGYFGLQTYIPISQLTRYLVG